MSAKPSRAGLWVVIAILAAGLLFMGGLYLTAWKSVPPEYRKAVPGIPQRALTLASWNLEWSADPATAAASLRKQAPDLVLLQQVTRAQAQEIARALEMAHAGQLQMFYSQSNPGTTQEPGNAILSRWPLYQGREMTRPTARGFGILAEPVIDQKRFLVGCVDLAPQALEWPREIEAMMRDWQQGGSIPFLCGGDFQQGGQVTGLQVVGAGPDRVILSPGWAVNGWGQEVAPGSKRSLIWVRLSVRPASTRP